jgi:hypothetical protein
MATKLGQDWTSLADSHTRQGSDAGRADSQQASCRQVTAEVCELASLAGGPNCKSARATDEATSVAWMPTLEGAPRSGVSAAELQCCSEHEVNAMLLAWRGVELDSPPQWKARL